MDTLTPEAKAYLNQLYSMTQGDQEVQVSMYEVGEALGLEKDEAGVLAQDLFIGGDAELKTLSGGIGITRQGLLALDMKIDYQGDQTLQLGKGPVLDDRGKEVVEKMLGEIQAFLGRAGTPYGKLEEMVMDIKTIEIQMLSPNPKTGIIREVFKSMGSNLSGDGDLKGKLDAVIAS
ncbi:MAG: hypothetical protein KKF12_09995 [Proteobacteria bacterium]|nr:hypothetical protein [Desulfobacula sp.]MBU3950884.1 hypothetical protein [Pseudomonadota bacterium]MBU4131138.1 hypothetical protein [Pseudomonadota bacterium]